MTIAEKIRQGKKLLKSEQRWLDFYTEVYKNSYPQVDFIELVKNVELVNGLYNINFQSFIIAEKTLKEIEKRLKPKHYNRIKSAIPKIIYNE